MLFSDPRAPADCFQGYAREGEGEGEGGRGGVPAADTLKKRYVRYIYKVSGCKHFILATFSLNKNVESQPNFFV